MRAGNDNSNIHIDVIMLFLDGGGPVSLDGETGLESPRLGGIAHAILWLRQRININISKNVLKHTTD